MVRTANGIFAQVGVTFDLGDRITVTNVPDAYDINVENEGDGRWNLGMLSALERASDVVSCYFVNRIFDDEVDADDPAETVGVHRSGVLAVSARVSGSVTFAHELGHYLGMRDIYDSCNSGGSRAYVQGRACYYYESADWNNGCVCSNGPPGAERYYKAGTFQREIIERMLMNGSADDSQGSECDGRRDITHGMIYGYDRFGSLGDVDTGFFKE